MLTVIAISDEQPPLSAVGRGFDLDLYARLGRREVSVLFGFLGGCFDLDLYARL